MLTCFGAQLGLEPLLFLMSFLEHLLACLKISLKKSQLLLYSLRVLPLFICNGKSVLKALDLG
jgi:hypothetical protein